MQATWQCPFCVEEDCFHLFLACPRSVSFWNFIGLYVWAPYHSLLELNSFGWRIPFKPCSVIPEIGGIKSQTSQNPLNSLQSPGVEGGLNRTSPQESNSRIKSTILLCILWNRWKCRNMKVFRHEDGTNVVIHKDCNEDLMLWSNECSSPFDNWKFGVIFPNLVSDCLSGKSTSGVPGSRF